MNRKTIFSDCRRYRYTLWRDWSKDLLCGMDPRPRLAGDKSHEQFVQFIGLNPSTADETLDDPTIRRCIGFAKAWGYGAMCMTNLFAFRATDPAVMKKEELPVNPLGTVGLNDRILIEIAREAAIVVCAWGKDGRHIQRHNRVLNLLRDWDNVPGKVYHLGTNGDGTPKHPLYLKKTLTPILWT